MTSYLLSFYQKNHQTERAIGIYWHASVLLLSCLVFHILLIMLGLILLISVSRNNLGEVLCLGL